MIMKAKLALVALCFLSMSTKILAQSSGFVNYFTVSSTIAQPVTIQTNLGTFTFSGTYCLEGKIENILATDINGNWIVINDPTFRTTTDSDNAETAEYHYTFSSIMANTSPYVYNGSYRGNHNPYYFSAGLGETKGFMAKNNPDWMRKTYASIGYGTQYGGSWGMNLTAKTVSGLFGLSGGLGYDNRIEPDQSKATWYLALLVGLEGWDVEFGPMSKYSPRLGRKDNGYAIMTNAQFPIYGPFGLNAGIGAFYSKTDKQSTSVVEYNIGITVRLHQSTL